MDVSFIIPIYNRPEELSELLESMTQQVPNGLSYEIIVVEDGSTTPSDRVVKRYQNDLPIIYITQSNTGPGGARNRGAEEAQGDYLHFLDSDTLLPPTFFRELYTIVQCNSSDIFGGPDRATESFTMVQKAIDYSMTSFWTTGGIRGHQSSLDTYYPRTFNMGILRRLFLHIHGFRNGMRYGEDLDLSMRAIEVGGQPKYYPQLFLYHKRRVSYSQFFQQIRQSGRARILLNRYHPGTLRWVHCLPTIFVLMHFFALLAPSLFVISLLYALIIFIDAFGKGGGATFALHAVAATYTQHFAYGFGFIEAMLGLGEKKVP